VIGFSLSVQYLNLSEGEVKRWVEGAVVVQKNDREAIMLSVHASVLVKDMEPYGSQEHRQQHDCDVYGSPDR
jgi:hypothetical protein